MRNIPEHELKRFERHLVHFINQAGLKIHVDGFYQIPTFKGILGAHIPSINKMQMTTAKGQLMDVWHCEAILELSFQGLSDDGLLPLFWNSVHMYVGELGVDEPLTQLVAYWYQSEMLPWLPDAVKEHIQALDWHKHAVKLPSVWE